MAKRTNHKVIPAKAGISVPHETEIPAFAGMTVWVRRRQRKRMAPLS